MKAISALKLDTNVTIGVKDAVTGKVLHTERRHNRVPLAGRNAIRDALNGTLSSVRAGYFAVGTGTAEPTDGDVALVTEVWRDAITRTIPSASKLTVQYYLPSTAANGYTLTEAGLWTAATGGVLLARVVHSAVEKNENITITYSWDIEISAG